MAAAEALRPFGECLSARVPTAATRAKPMEQGAAMSLEAALKRGLTLEEISVSQFTSSRNGRRYDFLVARA